MENPGTTQQAPRATAVDWGKAFLCSAALLILLLLLCLWPSGAPTAPSIANVEGSGEGAGGDGDGAGSGIGPGEGSGTGESGEGPGAGSAGEGRGADTAAPATDPAGSGTVAGEVLPELPAVSAPTDTATTAPPAAAPPTPVEEPVAEPATAPPPAPERFALVSPPTVSGPAAPTPVATPGLMGKSGGSSAGKNVGGMFVKGSRLGVILDVSGSMTSYLESLRQEIRTQFADAVFLEVNGCDLTAVGEITSLTAGAKPTGSQRDSVMGAIRELVLENKVDSVYWFCDLQDYRAEDALHELRELVAGRPVKPDAPKVEPDGGGEFSGLDDLKKMNENRAQPLGRPVFHLYIRSVGLSPDPPLERVIRESGGSFQKKN